MGNVAKTIFGYSTQFTAAPGGVQLTVPEVGVTVTAATPGSAIRMAWQAVTDKLNATLAGGGTAPPRPNEGTYHEGVAQRLRAVNALLVPHGYYALSEDLTGAQIANLETAAAKAKGLASPLPKAVEDEIVEALFDPLRGVKPRALNMVGLWMKSDTLKEFSHVVEQAYMAFYTGEMITVSMVLTPVIEGVLLRWFGFDPSKPDPKPGPQTLLNFVAEKTCSDAPQMVHPLLVEENIWAFANVFERLFFSWHTDAHKSSFFNRHYIAHLMGTDDFFRRNNVVRLLLLSDLLAHIVAACDGQHDRFETENKEFEERAAYYLARAEYGLSNKGGLWYAKLMNEHKNFKFA